ncbi:neurofibromin isoform X2 [Octopus sinensis]|uniref:Neurofibromin isoform X2 n=1 Tax=Octopus sinensis TaxID=2607531 RepID=A0A7E6FT60_9MOLL|nr:neurofibromin isoform X2 [Octopus sinensis]
MLKKKHFIDEARKALSNPHGGSSKASQTEGAAVTFVRMCKASTYININDRPNVLFTLVQSVTHDLKTLLFSPPSSTKFSRSQGTIGQDIDLYIDCFVSFFRINPYIGDLPKVCLNPQSPLIYHLVLVSALYKIITQPRLAWWPEIRKMYSKAGELRSMFNDAVNKVMQATASQGPKTQFSTITKMTGFKLSRPGEENTMQRYFLLGLVKLIHADPLLMLHNPDKPGHEVQNSTSELINGLVSLVHVQQMPEIAQEAMEALLRLHQPEIIALWNPEAPINTFWKISSQVLTSVSQKLIQNQLNPNPPGAPPMANNTEILKWLHEILICRNSFLQKHSINANLGSNITICTDSHIVLEEVFFMYLWSIDVNAVLTAMSCFHLLCEEADIRCGADEVAVTQILPNYNVYSDLAAASMTLTTGRALLQKKIMGLLRKIDHPTPGNTQAWEDTCKAWDNVTKNLDIYPKGKLEEGCSSGSIGETIRLRRKPTHHGTSDHELEDQLNEWVNMTGFLCALGSVALQNNTNRSNLSHFLACFRSPSMPGCGTSRKSSLMQSSTGDPQCCLVTQFIENLLKFLVCQHEKFGAHIQKHVKALLGHELNPALYPNLFDQVKLSVEKSSFDSSGQVEVTDLNTQFIENIIFIMKNILEMKSDQPYMSGIWIPVYMPSKLRSNSVNLLEQDLDQASMEAVAALLAGLPLQPEESDRGDLNEAKSQLFLKYLTLFMNLLNDCSEEEQDKAMDPNRKRSMSNLSALRHCTVQAMSNLLNANIESGLMHSIALGYHKDPQTRAAFMEVLTKILQQGTEFETLAETALADRFERLVELVTMIGDKGDLPIAMALASVILRSQMDELARVFVTLFDAKHLLYQLLWNMFSKEVEIADCMQTLFRGNSLASKIMAYCFRFYGQNYLRSLLNPLIQDMMDIEIQNPNLSYEIDPSRLESTENIEENKKNLMIITQKVFNAIVGSASRFPAKLRSMCNCLSQVVGQRFQQSTFDAVWTVIGTVIFLRFINPAIVSPYESGIIDQEPTHRVKRGLTLMCKIMQNIANHLLFTKEQHMRAFNDFLKTNFEAGRKFFKEIASDCETVDAGNHNLSFINDANVLALHRLLWNNQEKIGDYLSSSRDHKAVGRRPFDKLATLLAYLGPPEHRPLDSQ